MAKTCGSVWKGPGVCFGERAAASRKKRGPILNMRERPPTWVGAGFMNFFPSLAAGLIGMLIRWRLLPADSPIDLGDGRGETGGISTREQPCRQNSLS
jgi:hypothetical protein